MSNRIEDLAPEVIDHAVAAIEDLKASGVPHVVFSTTRTTLDQIINFMQGRGVPLDLLNLLRRYNGQRALAASENITPITYADGIQYLSNHQGGHALDVVPANEKGQPVWPGPDDPRWLQIAEVMKRHGFNWGGDWPAPKTDRPHYERI